jgi:hypothetical protein
MRPIKTCGLRLRASSRRVLKNGDVPAGDKTYLAQLVAARAGVSQADAEKRVDDVIAKVKAAETKARQIADATRKAGAYLSIYTGVTMLIGAFYCGCRSCSGGSASGRGLARSFAAAWAPVKLERAF